LFQYPDKKKGLKPFIFQGKKKGLITARLSRQEGLTIVRLLQDKKEVDDLSSFSK
jgi:hypothetical protein